MTRIIFSIPVEDKQWVEAMAKYLSISMAEVIRRAIKDYRYSIQDNNTQEHSDSDNLP